MSTKTRKTEAGFVEALKEEGKVVGYELRLLTKTGKTRNVLVNGMIEDGIMSGMTMDITERKAMEEELRENEERHRAMFEGSLDAIVLVDPETGEIIDANPAAVAVVSAREESDRRSSSDGTLSVAVEARCE